MSGMIGGSLSSVPREQIIDFECAELRRVPFQDSLYLWVKGHLPGPGYEARLAPRFHHGRPDYWDIEVAAIATPFSAENIDKGSVDLQFERSVPLTGITGYRGISVIGANQVKRIEISDESF
ncbi:MAG: hypothetical protein ACRCY3_04925 [Sphingorhabdus sp.]